MKTAAHPLIKGIKSESCLISLPAGKKKTKNTTTNKHWWGWLRGQGSARGCCSHRVPKGEAVGRGAGRGCADLGLIGSRAQPSRWGSVPGGGSGSTSCAWRGPVVALGSGRLRAPQGLLLFLVLQKHLGAQCLTYSGALLFPFLFLLGIREVWGAISSLCKLEPERRGAASGWVSVPLPPPAPKPIASPWSGDNLNLSRPNRINISRLYRQLLAPEFPHLVPKGASLGLSLLRSPCLWHRSNGELLGVLLGNSKELFGVFQAKLPRSWKFSGGTFEALSVMLCSSGVAMGTVFSSLVRFPCPVLLCAGLSPARRSPQKR